MLIRDAEIECDGERSRADVLLRGDRIATITAPGGCATADAAGPVVQARGGALLPALHDHHIHLLALAAAMQSVDCGPPAVGNRAQLGRALAAAPPRADGWIRGVGYHESVAGELDRRALDRLAPGRRVRIQHRSGQAWLLSSAALAAVGLDNHDATRPSGVELDDAGQPTGRLFRLDDWLRARLPSVDAPPLEAASRTLAAAGVASVTDATPTNDGETFALLSREHAAGRLRQQVVLMGGAELADVGSGPITRGAVKLILDERALPSPEALTERIAQAHAANRAVAIHCVTRSELVLAAHALEVAGTQAGDRIEHASVAPPDTLAWLARLGVCVVTQPGFVFERGDAYLRDVGPTDRPWLYRCAGFDAGGVALGAGTDAPYSDPDPWRAIRAAVDRRTAGGATLGADEQLSPERALALFTTPRDAPGGTPRRVAVGQSADLVLLARPWSEARERLESGDVVATVGAGRRLFDAASSAPSGTPDESTDPAT